MKRDRAIPGWYCACGNPNGFEASVFRAQGLVPTPIAKARRGMIHVAGFPVLTGHDDRGANMLWVPSGLDTLIRCGAEITKRWAACKVLGQMTADDRASVLHSIDAAIRLTDGESGIHAILEAA